MVKRVTISTSAPATRLRKLAQRLRSEEFCKLSHQIRSGARVVVFNIDGDRVTLAEQREMKRQHAAVYGQ